MSTTDQDPQLQLDALTAADCQRIYTDHASGAATARPGELEIRILGVLESVRHTGVARALVAECEALAHRRGLSRVVLSTEPSMTAAVNLYEGLGYVRTPERDWVVNGYGLITYGRDLF